MRRRSQNRLNSNQTVFFHTGVAKAISTHSRNADGDKKKKSELTRAHLALLAGAILIALGSADFAQLSTKIGVGCVLYYLFAGKVFEMHM